MLGEPASCRGSWRANSECRPYPGAGAVADRAGSGPTPTSPTRTSRGSPAARRLADHRRPLLRRPGAVAARPRRHRLLGRRPDAADHRAHGVTSTTWSAPSSAGRRPLLDAALRPGADRRARATRSGATTCRCGSRRSRCAAASRCSPSIARNTNLLGVRTPSRLELSYLQTASDLTQMIADGRFPYPGAALRPRRLPAGRRRVRPARRRRHGDLRQPQRAVGLPPARADRRPRRARTWREVTRELVPRRGAPTRRRSARCSAAGRRATPSSATADGS